MTATSNAVLDIRRIIPPDNRTFRTEAVKMDSAFMKARGPGYSPMALDVGSFEDPATYAYMDAPIRQLFIRGMNSGGTRATHPGRFDPVTGHRLIHWMVVMNVEWQDEQRSVIFDLIKPDVALPWDQAQICIFWKESWSNKSASVRFEFPRQEWPAHRHFKLKPGLTPRTVPDHILRYRMDAVLTDTNRSGCLSWALNVLNMLQVDNLIRPPENVIAPSVPRGKSMERLNAGNVMELARWHIEHWRATSMSPLWIPRDQCFFVVYPVSLGTPLTRADGSNAQSDEGNDPTSLLPNARSRQLSGSRDLARSSNTPVHGQYSIYSNTGDSNISGPSVYRELGGDGARGTSHDGEYGGSGTSYQGGYSDSGVTYQEGYDGSGTGYHGRHGGSASYQGGYDGNYQGGGNQGPY